MKTYSFDHVEIDGTIIPWVKIENADSSSTFMSLVTFQTQFPNEPVPTTPIPEPTIQ